MLRNPKLVDPGVLRNRARNRLKGDRTTSSREICAGGGRFNRSEIISAALFGCCKKPLAPTRRRCGVAAFSQLAFLSRRSKRYCRIRLRSTSYPLARCAWRSDRSGTSSETTSSPTNFLAFSISLPPTGSGRRRYRRFSGPRTARRFRQTAKSRPCGSNPGNAGGVYAATNHIKTAAGREYGEDERSLRLTTVGRCASRKACPRDRLPSELSRSAHPAI